jgi:hypothetical protein
LAWTYSMRRRAAAQAIGLGFQCVIEDNRDARPEWILEASRALLQNVRELVSEELLSRDGVGIVATRREENVRAMCEGKRANRAGFRSHVYANGGEIGAERRLHLSPHVIGQRLAAAPAEV